MGRFAAGNSPGARRGMLSITASGLMRAAGPDFSTTGVEASVERRLPGGNRVRVSYANGNALVMPALPQPASIAQVIACGPSAPRADLFASRSRARWTAPEPAGAPATRWQPDDTVTAVAPFASNAAEPYPEYPVSASPSISPATARDGFEALLDVQKPACRGLSALYPQRRLAADLRPGPAQHPRRPGLHLLISLPAYSIYSFPITALAIRYPASKRRLTYADAAPSE